MEVEFKWQNEKDTSDSDLFSAVTGMRIYSFTKKGHHHRWFLVKVLKFTEHNFYFYRSRWVTVFDFQ